MEADLSVMWLARHNEAEGVASRGGTSGTRAASSPDLGQLAAGADLDVPFKTAKDQIVSDFERRYLMALLRWADGNVSMAARKAGLDRMYLHRLLQRHGLKRSE
jgi:transcriptional regulator of acetoin/glycerol metabolism